MEKTFNFKIVSLLNDLSLQPSIVPAVQTLAVTVSDPDAFVIPWQRGKTHTVVTNLRFWGVLDDLNR